MFAVQQHTNSFVPDALKQGLVLQQGQAWLQAGGQPQHVLRAGGPQQAGLSAHQAPQQLIYQQQPQQVRMQMPISAAQLQPQQQQQFMLAAQQPFAPQPAGTANPSFSAVQDGNKQVVLVNVGGTLRRGIVQNGAVYLLPEDASTLNGQRPQLGPMPMGNSGHALAVQQQPQQPMMVQQVLSNGQLVPVSGAMVAPRAGVQLPSQQLQVQPQAPPAQLQAQGVTMGFSAAMQQHQAMLRMDMGATAAANQRVLPVNAGAPFVTSVGPNARVLQQQQQATMLQLPQAAAARGPIPLASGLPGQMLGGNNSVSASTASLMPRMPASSAAVAAPAPGPTPAGSQPMTIAAALAALPTNATVGGGAAPGNDLCSPVAPPGTPGMGSAPVGTIGAVISKLAAAGAEGAGPAIISGPPVSSVMGVAAGTSPLTSQPGTPPRSNSVGNHSSSSSSSGGSETDTEAKAGMMRMLARTFIETGIGLQQALSMIQPADAEMLAAAFAAEVAEASAARAPVGQPENEWPAAGAAALGADTNTNTRIEGAGMGLLNTNFGGSVGGGQDSGSLGSWGFSLFSGVTSEMGSQQGGNSFGGIGDKVMGVSSACGADAATATMFANLHV